MCDPEWTKALTDRSMQAGIIIGLSRACAILSSVQGAYLDNREAYDALQDLYVVLKTEERRLEAIHDNRE